MTRSDGQGELRLSEAGLHRREEILTLAVHALDSRVRRGRHRRWAGTAAAMLLCASGIMYVVIPSGRTGLPVEEPAVLAGGGHADPQQQGAIDDEVAAPLPEESQRMARIEIVRDDAGVVERLKGSATITRVAYIEDSELFELLRAAGRPDGLIRTGDRVMLSSEIRAMAEKHSRGRNGG